MRSHIKPVKVTVSDPETGEVLESRVVANDYVLITVGNRYVKSIQQMGRTHMIAVAVTKPKGIWCPHHPDAKLVRTELPNGKIDLRCPACTEARRAGIQEVTHG